MSTEVVHRPERSRFEAVVDGTTAYLSYERSGSTVVMIHTIVPAPIGGRGVAGELTRTAVEWAREQGLAIDPLCSYVRSWLAKQP
mgnify:CR=1 FL=1